MIDSLIRLDEARTYTMRELNQHTARVLAEINESRRPAAITRHGRFIALITPLEGAEIESLVLRKGPIEAEVKYRATVSGQEGLSSEDVLTRLGEYHASGESRSEP
jgi:antitoxin (DNA-binding transcriptional repressor) of toxin-antitoxin stability system